MKKCLLLIIVPVLVGCTTIGQQITNRDGTLQIQQYGVPLTAQSSNSTWASVQPLSYTNGDPNQQYFYSDKTGLIAIEPVNSRVITNTKTTTTTNSTYNTNTNITTPTTIKDNQIKTNTTNSDTNNVTVNVYTDTINIKESSFLSDVYNYLFEEKN